MTRRGTLFDRLCDRRHLEDAWNDIRRRYVRDRVPPDIAEFERKQGREIDRLAAELKAGAFLPEPASLLPIRKAGKPSEWREITLMRPADRIVLTALNRLLDPLFERQFLDHSYAYRKGRSPWSAVERVERSLRNSLDHTAQGDIDDFFGSLNRERLLGEVKRTVWEQPIIDLLETYFHIGATARLEWVDTGRGIAQGSPLSPLLSNVYLLEFDRHLDTLGVEWVRYSDDFILLGGDPDLLRRAFDAAELFLQTVCGLKLNAASRVFSNSSKGFDFLGFHFQDGRRAMSAAKLDQKRQAIAETLRKHSDLKPLVESLSETIRGWRQYYGASPDAREQLGLLEQHLFDLLTPWLRAYRAEGHGKGARSGDLKAALLALELPHETDPKKKVKWIEMALARSRPESAGPQPARSAVAHSAIERRKREIRAKKEGLQDLIVSQPGTYLGRSGERLLARRDGKKEAEIPLAMLRNISLLTTAASLSADLMAEAAARGITIHILGHDGKPAVRIGPPDAPLYHLSAAQTRIAGSVDGLRLAAAFVRGKIHNQANLLRYYAKYRERRGGAAFSPDLAIQEMDRICDDLSARVFAEDPELERNRLFAAEGQAAGTYWRLVKSLLWRNLGFEGRVRRGAGDLVNVMLNYGYGILYSRLTGILARTGLNVSIGFLHKPQPGKPALVFDFIEEFRPGAVDRAVFSLLNLGKEYRVEEGRLDTNSRQGLARAVLHRLHSQTRYRGETLTLGEVMEEQARLLARHIDGKEEYRSYVQPW